MPKFDPKIHHRRSVRLQGFDYTQAGAYFVTMVTWRREALFGEIVNGEMRLNKLGKIADQCWQEIPNHFPNVEIHRNTEVKRRLIRAGWISCESRRAVSDFPCRDYILTHELHYHVK